MILVDGNLLVYAWGRDLSQHESARAWLDERLSGTTAVGLPWPSLLTFLRLVSNPRVFERPAPIAQAWAQIEAWLACRSAWIPLPTEEHREVLGRLVRESSAAANLIPDAHLAALAI